MANGDFDPFPRDGESREQYTQRFENAMLAEDWGLRFQADCAGFHALGKALAEETDFDRTLALIEQRSESFVRCIGSGVLSAWKDDVITRNQQFEANFSGEVFKE